MSELESPAHALAAGIKPMPSVGALPFREGERSHIARVEEEERLPISHIRVGPTPRSYGRDQDHVRTLAEVLAELPPIIVRRGTNVVVDGAHRLEAARLRGDATVEVKYFDGSDEDAYIESVHRNIAHGKPLHLVDRRRAAREVLRLRPSWSDRRIAATCGLSAKTVASIRASEDVPQSDARVGRDGRERPLDVTEVRSRVAELIRQHPEASLRAIAREAGVSPATVRDVRRRLVERSAARLSTDALPPSPAQSIQTDTSLVGTSHGQALLALLQRTEVLASEWYKLLAELPMSRLYVVAEEARCRAHAWRDVAGAAETLARTRARSHP